MIPSNLRTPGFYADVNINTERGGLPANTHKVLFLTLDNSESELVTPTPIYDKASADAIFGENSQVGQMITAAIKTNRFVNVESFGLGE